VDERQFERAAQLAQAELETALMHHAERAIELARADGFCIDCDEIVEPERQVHSMARCIFCQRKFEEKN